MSFTFEASKAVASTLVKTFGAADDLYILRVSLNTSAKRTAVANAKSSNEIATREPLAVFEFQIKSQFRSAAAKTRFSFSLPTRKLKLPEGLLQDEEKFDGPGKLPGELVERIKAEFKGLPESAPLWIDVVQPCGYLDLVSWEDCFFNSQLKRPVLRLMDLDKPLTKELDSSLDVLLCVSDPNPRNSTTATIASHIVGAILHSEARTSINLHVFADKPLYSAFRKQQAFQNPNIQLHDPDRIGELPSSTQRGDTWLQWMATALGPRSIDVAHFVCHAVTRMEQGLLVLSESPTRTDKSLTVRFLSTSEIGEFLLQRGAWSVAFTPPVNNVSPPGLRTIANTLARERPGSVLIHDAARDEKAKALRKAYGFLYAKGPQIPPYSPAVSVYCHPSDVKVRGKTKAVAELAAKILPWFFSDPIVGGLAAGLTKVVSNYLERPEAAPAWLSATQRYIEQRNWEIRKEERDLGRALTKEQVRKLRQSREQLGELQKKAVALVVKEEESTQRAKAATRGGNPS
jgi:hypothetical protein